MTFKIYVGRRFVASIFFVFFGILMLAILFDAIELARRSGDADVSFVGLLGLAALRAPSISIKVAPYAVMLAAMWTYARLARSSELVVARAGGMSGWDLVTPVMVAAALVGVVTTTVYNPVAATLLDRFKRVEAELFGKDGSLVEVTREGLWLRQGNVFAQTVIHGAESNANGTELKRVMVLRYADQDSLTQQIIAKSAKLEPGSWRLETVVIYEFDPKRPEVPPVRRERAFHLIDTDLTPEQIVNSFAAPDTISFWKLPDLISTLKSKGFSSRNHEIHFHAALATPLIFAAMALLGSAFSMRHVRFGGLGIMALYAALTGFVVYFLLQIGQALAGSGFIAPWPAAWGPPFAALLFAAGLLLQFEDG
ncbi:MAG: LPS export ABC transporter permease LptG [Neomegalonema sp.]|nr:LPS export ABC transporter permease LptG [Neomegalonema sp.]